MIFSQKLEMRRIFLTFIVLLVIRADDSNSEGPDTCRCYCCPSELNPYKDKMATCDAKNPPLVWSIL